MDYTEHEQLFLNVLDETGIVTERTLEKRFSAYYADQTAARTNLVYARNSLLKAGVIKETEDPLEGNQYDRA